MSRVVRTGLLIKYPESPDLKASVITTGLQFLQRTKPTQVNETNDQTVVYNKFEAFGDRELPLGQNS